MTTIDPTLTISIDRTSLTLSALVFSGSEDAVDLGIIRYQPPALQSRVLYAPDSVDIHGSVAVGWAWQQSILGFLFVSRATTETAVQAAHAAVEAAITQFPAYAITTQVSGAPAQVWSADPGSISLANTEGRDYADLAHVNPVYAVTIPVYPIAGS